MRRTEGGFTTTELMVVVVIVEIMAALSFTSLKTDSVGQDARKLSALVVTARRAALSGGPVRPDITASDGTRARSQLTFEDEGGVTVVRVWVLQENPPASVPLYEWVELTGLALGKNTALRGVATSASLDPGGTLPTAPSGTITRNFFPDGTCEAMVAYLGADGSSKWRVIVLPAAAVPTVYSDW